jgi:hypothetical protein
LEPCKGGEQTREARGPERCRELSGLIEKVKRLEGAGDYQAGTFCAAKHVSFLDAHCASTTQYLRG